MDKMTIIGKDGKPRYEAIGESVTNLMPCSCAEPEPVDTLATAVSEGRVSRQRAVGCKKCGGLILFEQLPSEES